MPVVETWDKQARLMTWLPCPACGGPDWVHIVGWGFWCDTCNTQAMTRESACDSAYIVDFDTSNAWSEATNSPPGDKASAKFFETTEGSEPYWWSTPEEFESDWQPLSEPPEAV